MYVLFIITLNIVHIESAMPNMTSQCVPTWGSPMFFFLVCSQFLYIKISRSKEDNICEI